MSTTITLEFTHFGSAANPHPVQPADFNSDQQGSRYRSAECRLLRATHSRLAEQCMSSLIWRKHPPDLLSEATDWLLCLQNLPKAAQKTILRTESPLRHREAAER